MFQTENKKFIFKYSVRVFFWMQCVVTSEYVLLFKIQVKHTMVNQFYNKNFELKVSKCSKQRRIDINSKKFVVQ